MERTGLPINDQDIYCDGKKVRQIVLSIEAGLKTFPIKK